MARPIFTLQAEVEHLLADSRLLIRVPPGADLSTVQCYTRATGEKFIQVDIRQPPMGWPVNSGTTDCGYNRVISWNPSSYTPLHASFHSHSASSVASIQSPYVVQDAANPYASPVLVTNQGQVYTTMMYAAPAQQPQPPQQNLQVAQMAQQEASPATIIPQPLATSTAAGSPRKALTERQSAIATHYEDVSAEQSALNTSAETTQPQQTLSTALPSGAASENADLARSDMEESVSSHSEAPQLSPKEEDEATSSDDDSDSDHGGEQGVTTTHAAPVVEKEESLENSPPSLSEADVIVLDSTDDTENLPPPASSTSAQSPEKKVDSGTPGRAEDAQEETRVGVSPRWDEIPQDAPQRQAPQEVENVDAILTDTYGRWPQY